MAGLIILQSELADMIGVKPDVLRTFLGHFSLFKFVRYKYMAKNHRYRKSAFLVNYDSISALEEYLKLKMRYGKTKQSIKISVIEKLKKCYKEYTSDSVVKNEN